MDDKKERNCRFVNGTERFAYRAAAIIVEDGHVLLATNNVADYYYTIGGAVHLGETAKEAVEREVFEESGLKYEVDRLVFVCENFFCDKSQSILNSYDCHCLEFFYIMKPLGRKNDIKVTSECVDGEEYAVWLPIDKISEYKVLPEFIADRLRSLPNCIEHIVIDDRSKVK